MHDTPEPQDGHNSIPKGWIFFFIVGIICMIGYIASYTPALSNWSVYKEFDKEMASAKKTESAVAVKDYSGNHEAIEDGKEIFANTCAPCHNGDAKGLIGPNLTAPTLKYGSTKAILFETIAKGRPNGMPSFLPQIGADKISKVIAFLETLRNK